MATTQTPFLNDAGHIRIHLIDELHQQGTFHTHYMAHRGTLQQIYADALRDHLTALTLRWQYQSNLDLLLSRRSSALPPTPLFSPSVVPDHNPSQRAPSKPLMTTPKPLIFGP